MYTPWSIEHTAIEAHTQLDLHLPGVVWRYMNESKLRGSSVSRNPCQSQYTFHSTSERKPRMTILCKYKSEQKRGRVGRGGS